MQKTALSENLVFFRAKRCQTAKNCIFTRAKGGVADPHSQTIHSPRLGSNMAVSKGKPTQIAIPPKWTAKIAEASSKFAISDVHFEAAF